MSKIIHFLFGFICSVSMTATVAAAGRIEVPATIPEYEPFTARVWFAENLCSRNFTSVAGDVALAGNELTIVLSASSAGNCSQPQQVRIPGLPRGITALRISATASLYVGGEQTSVAETVSAPMVITPITVNNSYVTFWSGRFTPAASGAPQFALTSNRGSMFVFQWEWLEVGDPLGAAYTFKALAAPDASSVVPAALSPLLSIQYPSPWQGSFWTSDATVAAQLARSWGQTVRNGNALVGRATAAGCPLGMSSVFQLFHPEAITHRWTQSRSLYTFLTANGYVGEGVAWCAPALRGE